MPQAGAGAAGRGLLVAQLSAPGEYTRMHHYRVTIRFGAPRARYEMLDVEAADLRGALTAAASKIPEEVAATAELAEVRRQTPADDREYLGE